MWWDTIVLGAGMSVATMGTLPGATSGPRSGMSKLRFSGTILWHGADSRADHAALGSGRLLSIGTS